MISIGIFKLTIEIVVVVVFMLLAVAYVTVGERKTMAVMQRRVGPNIIGFYGLMQAFYNSLKLIVKEYIAPSQSNLFMFLLGPIITSFPLLSYLLIPSGTGISLLDFDPCILYLLAVSLLSSYGILLASWSANSKYSFSGSLKITVLIFNICNRMTITHTLLLLLFNIYMYVNIYICQVAAYEDVYNMLLVFNIIIMLFLFLFLISYKIILYIENLLKKDNFKEIAIVFAISISLNIVIFVTCYAFLYAGLLQSEDVKFIIKYLVFIKSVNMVLVTISRIYKGNISYIQVIWMFIFVILFAIIFFLISIYFIPFLEGLFCIGASAKLTELKDNIQFDDLFIFSPKERENDNMPQTPPHQNNFDNESTGLSAEKQRCKVNSFELTGPPMREHPNTKHLESATSMTKKLRCANFSIYSFLKSGSLGSNNIRERALAIVDMKVSLDNLNNATENEKDTMTQHQLDSHERLGNEVNAVIDGLTTPTQGVAWFVENYVNSSDNSRTSSNEKIKNELARIEREKKNDYYGPSRKS